MSRDRRQTDVMADTVDIHGIPSEPYQVMCASTWSWSRRLWILLPVEARLHIFCLCHQAV